MGWQRKSAAVLCTGILVCILNVSIVSAQVLSPPYFNLAVGRRITASATCGESVSEPELFCKLTGANHAKQLGTPEYSLIQGQLCDYCDPSRAVKSHPPSQAIDGTERWWQSPPLSRGLMYNEVNLTIDLGQEFHIAYVFIKMANSPRPGVFVLERSPDNGKTWLPWQYFADSESDCNTFFGQNKYTKTITHDDSVVCTTEYSKVVPLENGEIVVSLVNNRPSALNFSYSQTLQDWTKATSVRLRLLRTKTLLGHLMAIARADNTVTRRYYYSIKDISIGGRCVCNGHASICDKTDPNDVYKLLCRCQHNTCGAQCETCCPGFVQKLWRAATLDNIHACEPCQCYGHTDQCMYDADIDVQGLSIDIHGRYEGGGVCQNCRYHTTGINCNKCVPGYYRPSGVPLDATNVCRPCRCEKGFSTGECEEGTGRCKCKPQYAGDNCERCNAGYYDYPMCKPCDCFYNGTVNHICQVGGGQCPCLPNFSGMNCNRCGYGFYNFPTCQPCQCDSVGSSSGYCDEESGQCRCQQNYAGRACGQCANGYYRYPSCQLCNCDPTGSTEEVCDKQQGVCECRHGYGGLRCDRCAIGYYGYPNCRTCNCEGTGSERNDCDANGQCVCKYNYAGLTCDRCAAGYYHHPECLACGCDSYGSYGITCNDETGACNCMPHFEGLTCNKCKENYYNYPLCEECNCNPAGAKEVPGYPLGGCGSSNVQPGQLCDCKEWVSGHNCDRCKPGYWNLDINNPNGCRECDCNIEGTVGRSSLCELVTGQCVCKPYVGGRRCDQCIDGTYNLMAYSVFGCRDCNCDVGGSLDNNCNKETGQCNCRPRVTGRSCDKPLDTHYFPVLYQHKYEMEDGHTASGGAVRYGFDSDLFSDYSWRGYAVYSHIQDEVLIDVDIRHSSLYRLIFRYVNPNINTINANIKITPMTSTDVEQQSSVAFQPADERNPQLVTVPGEGTVSTFVLNPGRWTISLKTAQKLYVDYLVLLPQAYYEATILQTRVTNPCLVPSSSGLCLHYIYLDLSSYSEARGENAHVSISGKQERMQLFPEISINRELGTTNMALLDRRQNQMLVSLPVPAEGEYVFVLQYHSNNMRRLQKLNFDVSSVGSRSSGILLLPDCPYSTLCRQVVTDDNGNVMVFKIGGTHATITISGTPDVNVAIDSIIAIPISQWNLEMIMPRLKCVRRDGKCIASSYRSPAGQRRAEFESGPNAGRVATDVPPSIIDTSIRVIKLDRHAPTVNVKTSVSSYGMHVFLVHYYQPYNVGIDVKVDIQVDGQTHQGTFKADYCPSVSGCRAVIEFEDGLDRQVVDLQHLDINLSFNNKGGRPIWLDYVVVVPAESYSDDLLTIKPIDKSVDFITKCGKNDYDISLAKKGYCRDTVFSLTSEYNNGVLQCECNIDGSRSFNCDVFGGQCNCKPNVIGRACAQCRPGYYGFPRCQPCRCPSGLCDPVNGRCVCPPRVTGARCDTCLPRTFGFDALIGCEDCNCNPMGVVRHNLDCNPTTGQCRCKANVANRHCNVCQVGHYGFPRCSECSCDTRGTTEDICGQIDAHCLCKPNVEGEMCAQCKLGTFFLEDRNPEGCTKCFCFGQTSLCQSSTYRRSQIRNMGGWGLTNLQNPNLHKKGRSLESRIKKGDIIDKYHAIYWIAPSMYLGDKVTSYGGKLIFTVKYRQPNQNVEDIAAPVVRIEGNNLTVVHRSSETPRVGQSYTVDIDLLESNFEHETSGAKVSRDQFLVLLSNIHAFHIRAAPISSPTRISLTDVLLDKATARGEGAVASNVEQCDCPSNYAGTSCERCADGYYRVRRGPYIGVCVPCECNGHSTTCNPVTGECLACSDNFSGPQCLACMQGHYLDPFSGYCKMCPCPLAVKGNSFAYTCEVAFRGRQVQCHCVEGYAGPQCGSCALGWWGNPNVIGGKCQKCECSGNININDPTSCDPTTGECLKCLNNSAGQYCEQCNEWYWGDAVSAKNCRPCTCNRRGTERCDSYTGQCTCKPNVVGETCDRCASGTFGFESGQGCKRCDCAIASYSIDCDVRSGECRCQPGVTGRRCDQCMQGYWNYGPNGCQTCDCKEDGATTCDARTGICQCLPGVTGAKCDHCLPRWVLVPDRGCKECDSCVHLLLDDMDYLGRNITMMMADLESVSVGVRTVRRLENIKKAVEELWPKVDGIIQDPTDPDILVPYKEDLLDVSRLAEQLGKKAQRTDREADLVETDAADVRADADGLRDLTHMGVVAAREAVRFAQDVLQDILNNAHRTDTDQLIRRAERILELIKARDFNNENSNAQDELRMAQDALAKVKLLQEQAEGQANRAKDLVAKLDDVKSKLDDLKNNSRHAIDNSQASQDLNHRNRQNKEHILSSVKRIEKMSQDTKATLDMSWNLLKQARQFIQDARNAYRGVEREASRLDQAVVTLEEFINVITEDNIELRPLVDKATEHALKLQQKANHLDSMIANTREYAEAAFRASNAYQAIVDAIHDANNYSMMAVADSKEAEDISHGLAERALVSKQTSQELKQSAEDTKVQVTENIKPRLELAKGLTEQMHEVNERAREGLKDLLIGLSNLPRDGHSQEAQEAADKAIRAHRKAENAQIRIQDILDRLPEDKRKVEEIPRDIDNANRDIRKAQTQVDNVLRLVPDMTELLEKLNQQAITVNRIGKDLTRSINTLTEQISLSRGEASRIRVGVSFAKNVSLQVRNPVSLSQAGSYNKLSIYFRSKAKDGLLAYIGPDRTSRVMLEDYMSLEIINGKVVYKFNLGAGVGIIENPAVVNDGKWHEVAVERTGRTAKVSVRTDGVPDVDATGEVPGTFSVFDLNPSDTKFYIGGVPENSGLQGKLNHLRFSGCIEDVKYDGAAVGLWDFVKAQNNKHRGCKARGVLEALVSKGYRFNGNGYIVLAQGRFRPSKSTGVSISFRTFSKNGLLFLVGDRNDGDFLSVELRDGHVVFQYDLGSGKATLQSTERFNDGQWHKVFANRFDKNGLLQVDGKSAASGLSPGKQRELAFDKKIYIGGYKGDMVFPGVSKHGFEGCVKDLQLEVTQRDLTDSLYAKGVVPGCPQIARTVSFSGENAYIEMEPVNIESRYSMSMRVKSTNNDGLIFYTSNDGPAQENAFSIAMKDGKYVVITKSDGRRTVLQTNIDTYADGRWHYITVTKNGKELQLVVDDLEMVKTRIAGKKRIDTTTPLYFGGLPPGFSIITENVGTEVQYTGCIGDVTVNNGFVNFALIAPNRQSHVSLAGCPIPDPTPSTPVPTIPTPPIRILPPTGEAPKELSKCTLPMRPVDGDISLSMEGTRFGIKPESRWEFVAIPGDASVKGEFSIEFKTEAEDGMIMYMANERQVDFIALYMQAGRVIYMFNCGSGPARLTSARTFNDGKWHTATFFRNQRKGHLEIDGQEEAKGQTEGNSNSIDVQAPFYVGGLSRSAAQAAVGNLDGVTIAFVGCLRNLMFDSSNFGHPQREFFVEPCSSKMETGMFFTADGGYNRLHDEFSVGLDLDINFEFRPRSMSGVLLSVYSLAGDYLVLQMVDGKLIFNINNGAGEVMTEYKPTTKNELCNGQWHTVKAVKAKNVVTLAVDGVGTYPGIGEAGVSATDTKDPLYVGGMPDEDMHVGIKTYDQYVGCIRNLRLGVELVDLTKGQLSGKVYTQGCPIN